MSVTRDTDFLSLFKVLGHWIRLVDDFEFANKLSLAFAHAQLNSGPTQVSPFVSSTVFLRLLRYQRGGVPKPCELDNLRRSTSCCSTGTFRASDILYCMLRT